MREKSFIEILEDKMREQIRREIENEFALANRSASEIDLQFARANRFESWLASHVEPTIFTNKFSAKRAYQTTPKNARSGPTSTESTAQHAGRRPAARPVAQARTLTIEQSISLELLRRHAGVSIDENFNELELKGAWRKAALKVHPDRAPANDLIAQTKAAALFTELTTAYEMLRAAIEMPLAA